MKSQSNIRFISLNIGSNALLFARSIIFMKFLPESDLGIIMLFQAIVAILGLFQFGFFNGGLRLISLDSNSGDFRTINDNNVSYVILFVIFLVFISLPIGYFFDYNIYFLVGTSLCGGFAMLQNWFTNILVARKKLNELNLLNIISVIFSLTFSLLLFLWGSNGALVSISSSYVVFVFIFLFRQKMYRLSKLRINFGIIKSMLFYGFIPYLSGIAQSLNNQIDRFFVVNNISLQGLGQFYLAVLFNTVFNMLPDNINSIYYPKAVNSYSEKKFQETKSIIKNYFFIVFIYCLISVIIVTLFGNYVVSLVFPEKIEQLKYLYIMLPGIVAISLSKPISFSLYVALNQKAILWSNIVSLLGYLCILSLLVMVDKFTLTNVALSKSIQGVIVLMFLLIALIISYNKIKSFHYINKKY